MVSSVKDLLPAADYLFDAESGVWRRRGAAESFAYTDGAEVEQRLLQRLQSATDRSVLSPELLAEIGDWPSRYHFSPRRANLLRPLEPALRGRRVLEIGAGCGALTRYLGEIGAEVCAVEGSPARARVAAARCAGLPGVTVVAETLQALPVQPVFDVVTLIGVLEYARIFFPGVDGADPVDAMLACARRYLRPGGVLLVGIENQLGLKYFAGYGEDHMAVPMFGIEDRYTADGVVTFGRKALSGRLARAGLPAQQWLFPFPDYKLPVAVLTERGAAGRDGADLGGLLASSVASDPQTPPQLTFSLEQAWRPVVRNGLAGELANSFLVAAAETAAAVVDDEVLAWHFAVERAPHFAKITEFRAAGDEVQVVPRALLEAVVGGDLAMRLAPERFMSGELWQHELVRRLNQPGWSAAQLVSWAEYWLKYLCAFEPLAEARPQGLDTILPGHLLDAVPRNLLVEGGAGRFIDLEWQWAGGVSLGHLCYRAIVYSLTGVASVARPANAEDLAPLHVFAQCMQGLGFGDVSASVPVWHERERRFQCVATGVDVPRELSALAGHRLAVRAVP